MLEFPSIPMTTQLPLPETVEVRVSEPELLVTVTLNLVPERVAATVVALGSCLGPISYFSRSAFTSARRHSHCALVEMTVPSCMANGLGSFLLSAESSAADEALQSAPPFSDVAGAAPPVPPVPVVPPVVAPPVPRPAAPPVALLPPVLTTPPEPVV